MNLVRTLRHGLKRGLEIAVVQSGIAHWTIRHPKRRRLILAYHNVVGDDDAPWGEKALHLKRSLFERHIDLLQDKGRIVPLRNLLKDVDCSEGGRPSVALTFDDAYQGAAEVIEAVLVPRGIPCTVFVNPGLLGTEAFWWDWLATGFGGTIPAALRRECLEEHRGEPERIQKRFGEVGPVSLPPSSWRYSPPTPKTLERLQHLDPLVKLGCHTWSHPNLNALSRDEVRVEVERSRTWLEGLGGLESGILAYPYGLATPQVRAEAECAGCEYGLLVEGGYLPEPPTTISRFAVPRLPVPAGLSVEGLMLRVAGIR